MVKAKVKTLNALFFIVILLFYYGFNLIYVDPNNRSAPFIDQNQRQSVEIFNSGGLLQLLVNLQYVGIYKSTRKKIPIHIHIYTTVNSLVLHRPEIWIELTINIEESLVSVCV